MKIIHVCFPTIPPITLLYSFSIVLLNNVLYKVYHNKSSCLLLNHVYVNNCIHVYVNNCMVSYYKNILFVIILSVCIGDSNQVLVLS